MRKWQACNHDLTLPCFNRLAKISYEGSSTFACNYIPYSRDMRKSLWSSTVEAAQIIKTSPKFLLHLGAIKHYLKSTKFRSCQKPQRRQWQTHNKLFHRPTNISMEGRYIYIETDIARLSFIYFRPRFLLNAIRLSLKEVFENQDPSVRDSNV